MTKTAPHPAHNAHPAHGAYAAHHAEAHHHDYHHDHAEHEHGEHDPPDGAFAAFSLLSAPAWIRLTGAIALLIPLWIAVYWVTAQ